MRLANHGVSALVRPSRLPVFACTMMRTVWCDTRRAYVALTRHPGAVGGSRHHPVDIWEPMDPTAQDGCHRVMAAS
jgi:hypothetical protein